MRAVERIAGAASSLLGAGTILFAIFAPISVPGQALVVHSPQACIGRWKENLSAPAHFSVLDLRAPNQWELVPLVLVMLLPGLAAWRHASTGRKVWLALLWAAGLLYALPGTIPGCNMVAFGPASMLAIAAAVLGTAVAVVDRKGPHQLDAPRSAT
jgi:hypothetical protein